MRFGEIKQKIDEFLKTTTRVVKNIFIVASYFLVVLAGAILVYSAMLYILKNVSIKISKEILEYLKVIIWPSVILICIFLFKSNIAGLIERMDEWDIPFIGKGKTSGMLKQQQEGISTDSKISQDEENDFKAVLEKRETEVSALKKNTDELAEQLTRAQVDLDFERIYNLIFASQIELLSTINYLDRANFDYIIDYFLKVKNKNRPVFNEWDVAQYIRFLLINQLIENDIQKTQIIITQKGRAFLAYLAMRNYKKYGI